MLKVNKNIIILGCQRSGKTTLAKNIAQKYNYGIISIDSLIYAFEKNMPQLNINKNTKITEKTEIVSQFVGSYFDSYIRDYPEQNFIIEGCQLLPISVQKQKILKNCTIVCLGYPNANIEEIFHNIRNNDVNSKSSYTLRLTDEELKKRIQGWISYSKILQIQCGKLGIPFFETNVNRGRILNEIVEKIEKSNIDLYIKDDR